jgi:threonyl-tRNA synthetase
MIDHRRLGRDLDIFHSDPLVGAGLPIWLPDGAAARHAIESYLRELERRNGYRHVYSPPLARRELFERSGHLAHFGAEMFPPMADGAAELHLRPSLCPHHAMVFASRGRSYRDLPLRVAELGPMYREERSGVLGGLSRVRAISLNDAHIFCAEDRAVDELVDVFHLMRRAHRAVGMEPLRYRLSLPGAGGKYAVDASWVRAADLLRAALGRVGVSYVEAVGEAAFYGPKVDVQIADPAGRESTLSTIQLDFLQPGRFDLSYVDSEHRKQRPVIIHRSLLGSLERLMAHLLEVHNGWLPAWYAPRQLAVLAVGAGEHDAAYRLADEAVGRGLRAEVWADGSLGSRIRRAAERRVPHLAVIGPREAVGGLISLRDGRSGDQRPALPVPEALEMLVNACEPPLKE